jgi:ribonuclease R
MARNRPKQSNDGDPNAEREATKYDNPIVSRDYILSTLAEIGSPTTLDELIERFQYTEMPDQAEALRRRLKAMERDGQLISNRKGAYLAVNQKDLIRGRVIGHADGFGFLVPDDGSEDLYIPAREMRTLLHGDRVVMQVSGIDRKGRRESSLVEILERANERVLGRFQQEHGISFVQPDNKRLHLDVLIPPDQTADARDGQMVKVELIRQPKGHRQPIGRVTEVLGDRMAPGMEIDLAINAHGIPVEWPEAATQAAERLGNRVPKTAKDERTDLRHLPLVTIDGEDAKDFDDAVYCEERAKGRGWKLWVAIADVSHYVQPSEPLDEEAQKRATSVYFPGRVIPMLPEALSNGLCSLNPRVDRLCLVCEMLVDTQGKIERSRFYDAVMRSHARLTYTEVSAIVEEQRASLRKRHQRLVPHLERLHQLYKALAQARRARGTIDFDTTETRIEFGPEQKIARIVPVERNDAHRLIEECMIAANICAARFLRRHRMPALYRVHEGPDSQKLEDLRKFLGELGLSLGGGEKPRAEDYAALLDTIRERPDFHLIQTVLLRSLTQAVYHPDNAGHFGLALENYTHFTSPIRRYPDLLVHRAIRHVIQGGKPADYPYSKEDMVSLGDHCSVKERRADEATRDATDWLKCEYMLDKVGEEYQGLIVSVTSFGLFVRLDGVYVDGLVHISALDGDFYHFDPVGQRLHGARTGRVFRLADTMEVQVARVSVDDRKIDLVPAGTQADRQDKRRRKPQGKPASKPGATAEAEAKTNGEDPSSKSRSSRRKRRRRKPKRTNSGAEADTSPQQS